MIKKCKQCNKEIGNKLKGFCSQPCFWEYKKGKTREKKGKYIPCKYCKKEFYIEPSRIGIKKYCSRKCGQLDNWGYKPKKINCVICGKEFIVITPLKGNKKTCSEECRIQLQKEITIRNQIKRKNTIIKKECKNCKTIFETNKFSNKVYCSDKCLWDNLSKTRKEKNNPNYKTGYYLKKNRDSRQDWKHLAACQKYKKSFKEKHEYLFCEVCGVNQNGTPQFQVHHIYFASQYPKHPELHNFKNLINVCLSCHQNFHNGNKYKEVFEKIEKERGLKKLFNK